MSKDNNKFTHSLLNESLRNIVILVTGQWGSGKSLAGISFEHPSLTAFIDGDHGKGKVLKDQYSDLDIHHVNGDQKEDLYLTGQRFLEAIAKIDVSSKTLVVIDNIAEIEDGLGAYASTKPAEMAKRFNLSSKNIINKAYGHAQLAQDRLMKSVIDYFIGNNMTVVVIAHLKDRWEAPGQKEIKARRFWAETSSIILSLRRTGGAPDALVLKHAFSYHKMVDPRSLSREELEDYRQGKLPNAEIISRLPMRIPEFEAYKIYRYLSVPINKVSFKPDELVTMAELQPYSEILTTDQLANLSKIIEREERERERYEEQIKGMRAAARAELVKAIRESNNLPIPELVEKMKEEYPDFSEEINPIFIVQAQAKK